MKTTPFNQTGLTPIDTQEMRDVSGGGWPAIAIGVAVVIVVIDFMDAMTEVKTGEYECSCKGD